MSSRVLRFAPSPNGYLHLGHAYSALVNRQRANAVGGRVLLRMEDIDRARCRRHFEDQIVEDLDWLGIGIVRPIWRQSERFDAYRAALARLEAMGLVYPAFHTRGEIKARVAEYECTRRIWPRDPDGAPLYPDDDRRLSTAEARARIAGGAPYALRLRMDEALAGVGSLSFEESGAGPAGGTGALSADPSVWGDVVLARREVPTSYMLSVVVDDAAQGVTDVVRGRDLFAATSVHRLLQDLLGYAAPRYHHHDLVLGPDGRKLSKSSGDTALKSLREAGMTAEKIHARLRFGEPLTAGRAIAGSPTG